VAARSAAHRAGDGRKFFGPARRALTAYAEHDFRLSKPFADGTSTREHLLQAQKSLGRPPKGLVGPPFPDRCAHIWEMFTSLHSGRSYSTGGANPLSWADIKAWDDLMQANLTSWEVQMIKHLDMIWLKIMHEDVDHD
jgi:hypothetical protein